MKLKFEYNKDVYEYNDGWIYYRSCGCYLKLCPVLREIGQNDANNIVEASNTDQCVTILKTLVHAYLHGYTKGKAAKVEEFKRVFCLD